MRPIHVQSSSMIVIDLTKLTHPDDIKMHMDAGYKMDHTMYLSASVVKMVKFLLIKQLQVCQVPTCTIYGGFIVRTH